jgi:ribosomal protein S18 acetylase RimI-like enzyme
VTISLRPALPGDDEFLFSVYASTRAEEMELVNWTTTQKEAFLRLQFRAQDLFYRENYAGAEYWVIQQDDQPAGRLYVQRREDEIRIMDISLLPEFRRRGIGSSLLNQVLGEAAKSNLPVTIHVERFNPALDLYKRLGFRVQEDKGIYLFMKWLPVMREKHETARSIAVQ